MMSRRRIYTDGERRRTCRQVVRLVEEGYTFTAACNRLQHSASSVSEWFRKFGMPQPVRPAGVQPIRTDRRHRAQPAERPNPMRATDYLDDLQRERSSR